MFRAEYLKETLGVDLDGFLSLSTDSRAYNEEDIFWCLDGPSFSAFDYIPSVYKKGCRIFVFGEKYFSPSLAKKYPGALFVPVQDPLSSLQKLARTCIEGEKKHHGLQVIGVTGSNGKTTVKEILRFMLEKVCGVSSVFATRGNLNNHLGVPLTILSMNKECRFLVVEMGTNFPGEIAFLCRQCKPDVGLITNIGQAHLEFLHDEKGVLKEKTALYDYIKAHSKNPLAVINNDDKMLGTCHYPFAITFAREKDALYRYEIDAKGQLSITGPNTMMLHNKNLKESFNRVNLLQCTLFLLHLLPEKSKEIIKAAWDVRLPDNNRCTWKVYKGANIYLDAYNANPSSMEASLESFSVLVRDIPVEKVLIVLGDMNELGKNLHLFHQKIGRRTGELGFKNVCFVGRYSRFYKQGGRDGREFDTLEEFARWWDDTIKDYSHVFLKASRTLQLESLLNRM